MFKKLTFVVALVSAVGLTAMPFATVSAADAAKPAKQMTCKEEAKAKGLKGDDAKKHVKECKKERKAAKAKAGEGKK